jgi:putative membrane protein
MKKFFFKDLFAMTASVIMLTAFTACDNKPDDAKEAAEDHNEAVMDDRKSEKDAQFLVDAAEINLMEVHMGRMAGEKAMMQEVKDFGKKMEADHQKAYDDMAALAASKNIAVPGSPSEATMKDHQNMNEKTGYDFDRAFMDAMVDGHEKAISKFEKAADDCEDAEIKAWAAKMLPDLNAHLAEAKTLKEKVKDMK